MKTFFSLLATLCLSLSLSSQSVMLSTIQLDANLSLDGLLMTPDGTLYGTEGYDGNRLFRIELDGTTEVVQTGLNGPIDMDYNSAGELFISTFNNAGLYKFDPHPPTSLSFFANVTTGPSGVVVNRSTNEVFVSHYGAGFPGNGNSIYRVDPVGNSSVFAQGNGLQVPVSLAIDEAGNLYAPNIANARLYKISPDGTVELLVQLPTSPVHPFNIGHIAYANGYLYITGNDSQPYIFKVSLAGDYEIIAGSGAFGSQDGPGLEASFDGPNGIAASPSGNTLFVSELNHPGTIRVVDLNATVGANSASKQVVDLQLQSFPNPFDRSSTIQFNLAQKEHVQLLIYTADGTLADTLVDEEKAPGAHQLEWTPTDLRPGVYYLELILKNSKASYRKKAILH